MQAWAAPRWRRMKSMRVCDNAEICGGCFYQGTSYEEELKTKEETLHALFEPVVRSNAYTFEPIVPSPVSEGYRNKMEFSFGDCRMGGELTLGLHQKRSFFNIIVGCLPADASGCGRDRAGDAGILRGAGHHLPS